MQTNRKKIIATSILILLTLAVPGFGLQVNKDRVMSANGEGTLTVGKETFKVHSVVVKLLQDGKVEISIVSEITVFVSGTWTGGDDVRNGIDLQITTGAAGAFEGTGKLFLSNDVQSIARLTVQGGSKTSKRQVKLDFVAH